MSYRTIGFLVGAFLAGILVGWVVLGLAPGPSPQPRSQATSPASRPTPPASQPTPPASQQTSPTSQQAAGDPAEVARQKLLAGRLEEAQNDSLQLLSSGPYRNDPRVLQVLATIRRRLAHDDPVLLRRQAAGYRDAIARNVETGDHYTPEAMELLAQACLIAANELDAQTSAKSQPAGSVAAVQPSPTSESPNAAVPSPTPQPGSSSQRPSNSGNRPTRKPTPTVTPKKSPTPPPTPAPAPPVATATPEAPNSTSQVPSPNPAPALRDVNAPLYVVQVGPISEAERATAAGIAGALSGAGFASQVSRRSEPELYRVLSDPLAPAVAERRASFLAQRGLQASVRSLGGGSVQLDFGGFASREAAEALGRRVGSLGYRAVVTREGGTTYTINVGPQPQAGVDTIVGIIRSQFAPEIRVIVVRAPRPPSEQSAGK